MRFHPAFILLSILPVSVSGQFDLGVSLGGVFDDHYSRPNDNPHLGTQLEQAGSLGFSAAAFYRERNAHRLNLGVDLCYAHRSFDVFYKQGGLGGGFTRTAHVDIDQLYVGVKPELTLDAERWAVFRFGLMAGFRVGGAAIGSILSWSDLGPYTRSEDVDLTNDFGGDFRLALGFGLRIPAGDRWAVTVDPETTFALNSMLKVGAGIRGYDAGLRIGLSHRSKGRSLTQLFKRDRQARNAAPSS